MGILEKVLTGLAMAGVMCGGAAQAELIERGNGMLYDSVLNITWLQDANYARTSGYDSDGRMNWLAANSWAADLDYGGYSDWRLAYNSPVNTDWNYAFSVSGSTDVGLNITSINSELSYMFYVNLGLKGFFSAQGVYQPDYGVYRVDIPSGEADVGLVNNLQAGAYWSGVPFGRGNAWTFDNGYGLQVTSAQINEHYAWAVRSGDVLSPVPEPEVYALLMAGLGLLGVVAKRRRRLLGAS